MIPISLQKTLPGNKHSHGIQAEMRSTEKKEAEPYAVFGSTKLLLEQSKLMNVPQYLMISCIQVNMHYHLVNIFKYSKNIQTSYLD